MNNPNLNPSDAPAYCGLCNAPIGVGPLCAACEDMALDDDEPQFNPDPQPVVESSVVQGDGQPMSAGPLAELLDLLKASPQRATLNRWLKDAADAGSSWSPRKHPYTRQQKISEAALALAENLDGDDEQVRAVIALTLDDLSRFSLDMPVGPTLAALTADEAQQLIDAATRIEAT